MHPVFLESVHFPTEHICLKMRLRPLTLGHLAILNDAQSPFVTYKETIARPDLIFAVAVCSQTYERALDLKSDPGWIERLYLEFVTWRWGRAIKGLDLSGELERFYEYMAFHRRFPGVKPAKGDTRSLNSPIEWRLATMLIEKFHYTWSDAWSTPILRAHAMWACFGDREGWLELEPNDPISEARCRELSAWAAEQDKLFSNN